MANDSMPRTDARFHPCQNNIVTHVNGHLADFGLAARVMGAEISGRVALACRPQTCDPHAGLGAGVGPDRCGKGVT